MKQAATNRWWIGGILMLTGIGIVGFLAFRLLRPAGPFDFLSGAAPVVVLPPEPTSRLGNYCSNGNIYAPYVAYYSLPRDFGAVHSQAKQELLRRGFKIDRIDSDAHFSRRVTGPNCDFEENVRLGKDERYRAIRPYWEYPMDILDAPGWTSVYMVLAVRQSPIEAFVSRCVQWVISPLRQPQPIKLPDLIYPDYP